MNDTLFDISSSASRLLKRLILFCIFANISIFAAYSQQDPQFSLNKFNQLTVNPGFAGSSGLINMSMLNRSQWVGFPGAPTTSVFNTDAKLHLIGMNDGVGFSIVSDAIGFEKNVSVGLNYAYRSKLGDGVLGSGISLGLMNKNLNFALGETDGSDLVNQSDQALPKGKAGGIVADVGLGFFYQAGNMEVGFSGKHLNRPSITFNESGKYTLTRSYYLNGSYTIHLADERFDAIPSLFYKRDRGSWQADANITIQYNKQYWGSIGYRFGDALIISGGTELWNGIKCGYAYDMSISALSKYNAGSHEFFLAYSVLLYKKHKHKYNSVRFL